MVKFKAKIDGEKIILETIDGKPIQVREIIVKYSVSSTSPSEERTRRVISDSLMVEKGITKFEIPTKGLDVVGISVIYKEGEQTLREDLNI
ncbi:hypothetical protein GWK48_02090 [Metallosphaera tengchongensis]|uniref:Uncharacterized protein n=1 Tax=Metallosphaera tengchongensis TaxID=1532350 RepID=A0A6N0NR46_9CREN|nr:hypothetical protein [Metallosphaera tengchongensis]QKQ99343.1 hypothetical protein GWK48_02090 [Metallosphaera tengchongensis]